MNAMSAVARLTDAEATALGTDIQRRIGLKTSRREPLARFTTMRVGGPADLFAEVQIVVPARLGEEERRLFERLADVSTFDPRRHRR